MKSIEQLEKKYPDMLFTESEARAMYYVTAEGDKRISVIVKHRGVPDQMITMNVEQAYALSKEMHDMLFMIGRGKFTEKKRRGRKPKYA